MIRCVRLWTGEDQNSYFEEGWLELETGPHADLLTGKFPATTVSFQETASGGALDWHTAPVRQLVITLSGTLDFQTRDGEHFLLHPGDILLAEDTFLETGRCRAMAPDICGVCARRRGSVPAGEFAQIMTCVDPI
jgi:hypothetical protein